MKNGNFDKNNYREAGRGKRRPAKNPDRAAIAGKQEKNISGWLKRQTAGKRIMASRARQDILIKEIMGSMKK